MSQAEPEEFKLINAIEELTLMLSERLWSDDQIKDRFALASMADGARVAAIRLREEILRDAPICRGDCNQDNQSHSSN